MSTEEGGLEAEATLTMISQGVEISIAGGGVDANNKKEIGGWFLFYFLYHIFVC